MAPRIYEQRTAQTAVSLAGCLRGEPGVVLLHSGTGDAGARYSLVTARPFLTLRTAGARCEIETPEGPRGGRGGLFAPPGGVWGGCGGGLGGGGVEGGPFPLGGCFGFWGYDLKNFVEPKLCPRAVNDLEWPDAVLGFYASLVVFEVGTDRAWIVVTGLDAEGERSEGRAAEELGYWKALLDGGQPAGGAGRGGVEGGELGREGGSRIAALGGERGEGGEYGAGVTSTFDRAGFLAAVERAQDYIRAGHIYQVNLAQRFEAGWSGTGWDLYGRLAEASPAPFSAYLHAGGLELVSSSPELFLRMEGARVWTRPIKGTRPRSADPERDAAWARELQGSPKERAELVMITDLLRNDLGRVCEYGTVRVTELARWEGYAQVQHLVSTVEGRLRAGVTPLGALAACFPGGSVTGAPKFRAMEIIDELEPVARGPYTGCLGYLGFNRRAQLSMVIRTAGCEGGRAWWHVGAGIVADSDPGAEYEETLAKGAGVVAALGLLRRGGFRQDAGSSET